MQIEETRSKVENISQLGADEAQISNEQESHTFEEILATTKSKKKQTKAKEKQKDVNICYSTNFREY